MVTGFYFEKTKQRQPNRLTGFTIVELLIVIVVIAILVSIVTVAYNGIRERSTQSLLQSDLATAAKVLKLDQVRLNAYPATLTTANNGKGLSFNSGTEISYSADNDATPQEFCLSLTRGAFSYFITQSSALAVGTCSSETPVVTYEAAVLADAPAAYWRFKETSGTTVVDTSGNGRTLTLSSTTGIGASGLSGDAGDFSWNMPGTGGAHGSVANAAWQHAASFTVEAIIQPDVVASYKGIVSHDGSSLRSWNLYILDGKLHVYDYSSASGGPVVTSSTSIVPGQRYHVAMTYTSNTTRLYINGGLVGSRASMALRTSSTNMPFVVGASYAGTSPPTFLYDGRMDEVAFYDKALTAEQLTTHANTAGLGL